MQADSNNHLIRRVSIFPSLTPPGIRALSQPQFKTDLVGSFANAITEYNTVSNTGPEPVQTQMLSQKTSTTIKLQNPPHIMGPRQSQTRERSGCPSGSSSQAMSPSGTGIRVSFTEVCGLGVLEDT